MTLYAPATVTLYAELVDEVTTLPYDPPTLRFVLQPPSGPAQTLIYGASAIVRDGPGAYRVDMLLATPGSWHYRWEADGAVKAIEKGRVFVAPATCT